MPSPLDLVLSRPRVVPHRGACLLCCVSRCAPRCAPGPRPIASLVVPHRALPFFTGRGIPSSTSTAVGVPCARPPAQPPSVSGLPSSAPSTPSIRGAVSWRRPPRAGPSPWPGASLPRVPGCCTLCATPSSCFCAGMGWLLLLYWHHALAAHVLPLVADAVWPALCLVAFLVQLPGACLTNSLRACPRWLSAASGTLGSHPGQSVWPRQTLRAVMVELAPHQRVSDQEAAPAPAGPPGTLLSSHLPSDLCRRGDRPTPRRLSEPASPPRRGPVPSPAQVFHTRRSWHETCVPR